MTPGVMTAEDRVAADWFLSTPIGSGLHLARLCELFGLLARMRAILRTLNRPSGSMLRPRACPAHILDGVPRAEGRRVGPTAREI